jgi:hypothetical protein
MHRQHDEEVPAMSYMDGRIVVFAAAMLLLLLLGIGVKFLDLRRRRDEEAVAIQARISDALLLDPALSHLPIVPTVRVPLWRGKPAMVEVRGSVPLPGMRRAAVDLVVKEALRTGRTCSVVDRISVNPATLRHAA